jgi:hypothetical protein
MSTYIISRSPNRFGGQQESFAHKSSVLVSTTAALIKRAVDNYDDLEELFHKTLASLSKARNKIAIEHKTNDQESYGTRRDGAAFNDVANCSYLSGFTSQYNDRLIKTIQAHLTQLQPFSAKAMTIQSEPWLGRNSSITYEILSHKDLRNWSFDCIEENFQQLCNWCQVSTKDFPFSEAGLVSLGKSKAAMANLKKNAPAEYRKFKLLACFDNLTETFPQKKFSDFILATVRGEVDGKMFALAQYFVDLPKGPTPALRISAMTHRSIVLIIHQDPFLIEPMLADIAKIFKRAIQCHTNNVSELKEHMILFKYQFSQTMPFFHGTAAISEWMERAIYKYQGYKLLYNNDKMPTLEAWTSTLKQFADNYDSIVTIEDGE